MALFEQKCKEFIPRLTVDLEINQVHGSGIFGNVGAETGGFKHKQEINPVVKGSRGGYGWFQWTGPRRIQLEKFAKAQGFDIYNVTEEEYHELCYRFMVHECKTTEAKSIAALKKTTTVEAATETFMLLNLRPGVKHLDSRIRWGKKALAAVQDIKPEDIVKKPEPIKPVKPQPKPMEPVLKPVPKPESGVAAGGIMGTLLMAWQYSYKIAIGIAIGTIITLIILRAIRRKAERENAKKTS